MTNSAKRGISLIEAVFYIAILIMIIPFLTSLSFFIVNSQIRGEEANLLVLEGTGVTQVITQTIRNAEEINFPLLGVASSTLSLQMNSAGTDPTVFSLENGTVNVKEGTSNSVTLTSNKVIASGLVFYNVSQAGTPGSVKIEFELATGNMSKKFYAAASLR